jgi:hypothetical protein
MPLDKLQQHFSESNNKKLHKKYGYLNRLFPLIEERELSNESEVAINAIISKMNMEQSSAKIQTKALCRQQTALLRHIEKSDKLVVKHHYRNTWLALGMSGLGIPIGVAIGSSQGNMSMIGYGISIGMVMGLIFGSIKDKSAAKEGRQLDIELQP